MQVKRAARERARAASRSLVTFLFILACSLNLLTVRGGGGGGGSCVLASPVKVKDVYGGRL